MNVLADVVARFIAALEPDDIVRPMGRRAGQGVGPAHHSGARKQGRTHATS